MNRRQIITASAAALMAAATQAGFAQTKPAAAHHHHGSPAAELLIDVVSECIAKGETCLAHCIMLMGDGDKSVAGCAKSVSETLAVCESLRKLAAQGSAYAKPMARLAMDACLACEKECRKHEAKHKECRDCAKACADCAKECKSFAA